MANETGAAPEPVDAHIGKKAVELGLLTAIQLRDVLRQLSQSPAGGPVRLGETLVDRGLLTRQQLGVISDLAKGGPPRQIGKYRIVKELGRGGMGIVYEAEDPGLGRRVALKMLLLDFNIAPEILSEEEERFTREAKLSASLPKHPNIVGVYEAGAADGQRFISMEFVEGCQFSEWRTRKPVPLRQQIAVLRDVALAVDHAHRHNVVHRDLKPQNILVDGENRPHVTDFGLAKREFQESTLNLTVSGTVMGTPAYMSPEQAQGRRDLDHRSDIWALGVMLYEILAGRLPFEGESPLKVVLKAANDPVPPPSTVLRGANRPAPDRSIEKICMKALARDRDQRYATARDFANDLGRWVKGGATVRVGTRPGAAPKTWIIAAIAAVLGIGIVAAVAFWPAPPDDLAERPSEQRLSREFVELDSALAALRDAESFGPARDMLARAQARHEEAAWTRPIAKRIADLKKHVDALYAALKQSALDAKRKGDAAAVETHAARVARWKQPDLAADLQDALARAAAPPAPLPPTPPLAPPAPPPVAPAGPAVLKSLGLQELPVWVNKGHTNALSSMAFSPDGRYLITACFDLKVWLFDLQTREQRKLSENWNPVSTAASPDGRWFAVGGGDGTIRVWDASTLQMRRFATHAVDLQVRGLAYSPDSSQLASAGVDGSVRLWDVRTGAPQGALVGHPAGAFGASWSPDGKRLATCAAQSLLKVWELPSGRELQSFGAGQDFAAFFVAFLSEDRIVGGDGRTGKVTLWELESGRPRPLRSHTKPVRAMSAPADGRWFATAAADGLWLWDPATGDVRMELNALDGFYSVAVSPKGDRLAAGTSQWGLRIWDVNAVYGPK